MAYDTLPEVIKVMEEKKWLLEENIRKLIVDFENETGLRVTGIDAYTTVYAAGLKADRIKIEIEL